MKKAMVPFAVLGAMTTVGLASYFYLKNNKEIMSKAKGMMKGMQDNLDDMMHN